MDQKNESKLKILHEIHTDGGSEWRMFFDTGSPRSSWI